MTKPTILLCAQQRLRSAWASAQSDQSLRCPHEESLGPYLPIERTEKTLIRLDGCPGWSESLLGAHTILLVLSRGGSFHCINYKQKHTTHIITNLTEHLHNRHWEESQNHFCNQHILLPVTDYCPSWINRRERTAVEIISWQSPLKNVAGREDQIRLDNSTLCRNDSLDLLCGSGCPLGWE